MRKDLFLSVNPAGVADIHDFFEGDILLTPAQRKEIFESRAVTEQDKEEELKEPHPLPEHHARRRAVVRTIEEKWSKGEVPYELHSSLCKCFAP